MLSDPFHRFHCLNLTLHANISSVAYLYDVFSQPPIQPGHWMCVGGKPNVSGSEGHGDALVLNHGGALVQEREEVGSGDAATPDSLPEVTMNSPGSRVVGVGAPVDSPDSPPPVLRELILRLVVALVRWDDASQRGSQPCYDVPCGMPSPVHLHGNAVDVVAAVYDAQPGRRDPLGQHRGCPV